MHNEFEDGEDGKIGSSRGTILANRARVVPAKTNTITPKVHNSQQTPSQKNVEDKLQHSQETIDRALQIVAETEEVGREIADNLRVQTEKIKSIKEKTKEFQNVIDPAGKIIDRMQKRENMCVIS